MGISTNLKPYYKINKHSKPSKTVKYFFSTLTIEFKKENLLEYKVPKIKPDKLENLLQM